MAKQAETSKEIINYRSRDWRKSALASDIARDVREQSVKNNAKPKAATKRTPVKKKASFSFTLDNLIKILGLILLHMLAILGAFVILEPISAPHNYIFSILFVMLISHVLFAQDISKTER